MGLGASVNQSSSVTTVVDGATTPTVFTLTPSVGTMLTYTSSATITLDVIITTIDVFSGSASGGAGRTGGSGGGDYQGTPSLGGNGTDITITNYKLPGRTLKITVDAAGIGGSGIRTYTDSTGKFLYSMGDDQQAAQTCSRKLFQAFRRPQLTRMMRRKSETKTRNNA